MNTLKFTDDEVVASDLEHLRALVEEGRDTTGLISSLIAKFEDAFKENAADDEKVKVRKKRNVSCNADEEITYSINTTDWTVALHNNSGDAEQALLDLQHESKVSRIEYDCETTEISEEFDVEVEVI